MTTKTKTHRILATLAFVAVASTANAAFAADTVVPTTTAEHEALAKEYTAQAAQYKKVADDHKAMAAAYGKAHPDSKGGVKNSWNAKMQKHCETLAKDAEKLSSDAEKAADHHTARGKEIQGK